MFSKMLSRILVPYDGSRHSVKALAKAMELAHNLDSQIFLFSVVSLDYISPPGMLGLIRTRTEKESMKKWTKKIQIDTEKMLKTAAKRCQEKGITASYNVGRGNIAKEILNFCKKRKISLVVIGSQGRHGIGKVKTLGSVSRRISEHANCPVLIVR